MPPAPDHASRPRHDNLAPDAAGDMPAPPRPDQPRFHLRTYGCQMNERDSAAVAALLTAAGYRQAEHEDDADILLFNTCSVRDQAERKAVGKLGLMRRRKRDGTARVIGVLGCMAQRRGADLLDQLPHLDFVLGTGEFHRIVAVVEAALAEARPQVFTALPAGGDHRAADQRHTAPGIVAFVAVMRGCDRHCSYCIVPQVRGPERSRPADEIIAEARALAAAGTKEILLLGQNVAAYGLDRRPPDPDRSPFAELLAQLNAIPGLARIRFTSPHPAYFNLPLIAAVADLPKVCESIHLPVQSGSDRILRAMNRPYTAAQYLAIVARLRERIPDIAFSTDVIVGFPGETEEDFAATRDLMGQVAFDHAFIFKYSPRAGTPAANLPDVVPRAVKEERNRLLLANLAAVTARRHQAEIGMIREVLVEGPSKRNPRRWAGRTRQHRTAVFTPPPQLAPGDLLELRIIRATANTLYG